MTPLLNRLYAHYLMRSRLPLYGQLLARAHSLGYRHFTMAELATLKPADMPPRLLVHRHDIDSDCRTARAWFREEQKHGVRATYYFRLCTLDKGLMRDLIAYGAEVGYHYEEVASFAKRERLRSRDAVQDALPRMRAAFLENLALVEELAGHKVHTVASHGDFANRKLGIQNTLLLDDPAVRRAAGLRAEAYDTEILSRFDCYISDKPAPVYFHPQDPQRALGTAARICLLTHPVQWRVNWRENLRLDLGRMVEGWQW